MPNLNEVRYVKGAHSAGLVETEWPHIANFIVNGVLPPSDNPDYTTKQLPFWKGASKISTILFGFVIAIAVVILCAILWPVFTAGTTVTEAVYRTILALLYLLVLRFVVTRV